MGDRSDCITYTAKPNRFSDAAKWVVDQVQHVYLIQLQPLPLTHDTEPGVIEYPKIPQIRRMRFGHEVFREARKAHQPLTLWAVDYCDGHGPRVRIAHLVAEPTDAIGPWDIELS